MLDTRMTMGRTYGDSRWCPHCVRGREEGELESPEHLLLCEAYADIRQQAGHPEVVEEDRVQYLRKVIKRRKELEKNL